MTVSANEGYGIELAGSARHNKIYHTYIGTTGEGLGDLGNELGGIDLGAGTSATTIGGMSSLLQDKVFNSGGTAGVMIESSSKNVMEGTQVIASDGYGLYATGLCTGSLVMQNTIVKNSEGNVNLSNSRGITYIP